jgi:phospholipid/cholesterol/gamma-HCH transport system substrate-binding protein
MTPTRRHLKLGLLAILAVAALAVVLFALGIERKPVDIYYTYFDESVQGLELGAFVKYRGVRIGKVRAIKVAPDDRLIEVELAIDRERARALDLAHAPPELRAQVVIFGLTGVKLVDLDFVDPKANPAPVLSFKPPGPVIPSRQSLLESINDEVRELVHRAPDLVNSGIAALDEITETTSSFNRIAGSFEKANIGPALRSTLAALGKISRKASGAAGDLKGTLNNVSGAADQLTATLRDISEAARSLRELAETIDREPDVLVKGRARGRTR